MRIRSLRPRQTLETKSFSDLRSGIENDIAIIVQLQSRLLAIPSDSDRIDALPIPNAPLKILDHCGAELCLDRGLDFARQIDQARGLGGGQWHRLLEIWIERLGSSVEIGIRSQVWMGAGIIHNVSSGIDLEIDALTVGTEGDLINRFAIPQAPMDFVNRDSSHLLINDRLHCCGKFRHANRLLAVEPNGTGKIRIRRDGTSGLGRPRVPHRYRWQIAQDPAILRKNQLLQGPVNIQRHSVVRDAITNLLQHRVDDRVTASRPHHFLHHLWKFRKSNGGRDRRKGRALQVHGVSLRIKNHQHILGASSVGDGIRGNSISVTPIHIRDGGGTSLRADRIPNPLRDLAKGKAFTMANGGDKVHPGQSKYKLAEEFRSHELISAAQGQPPA